jgi:uncharacterized membrane protein
MTPELILLALVMAGFVGSHFALSHPLRGALVRALGEGGFRLTYSLIAMAFVAGLVAVYHHAHSEAPWSSNDPAWQVGFCLLGYLGTVLLLGSLVGNPALVGADLNGLSARLPFGALRVTRHPMMFGITLWSLAQVLLIPSTRNLICALGLIVLALLGAHLQDRRKSAAAPREWNAWVSRTAFWPDVTQAAHLGWAWGLALVPWLAVTWLETRLFFTPVGVWYFFPELSGG